MYLATKPPLAAIEVAQHLWLRADVRAHVLRIEPRRHRGRTDEVAEHQGQVNIRVSWRRSASSRFNSGLGAGGSARRACRLPTPGSLAAISCDRRGGRRVPSGPGRKAREAPRNRCGSRRSARHNRPCRAVRANPRVAFANSGPACASRHVASCRQPGVARRRLSQQQRSSRHAIAYEGGVDFSVVSSLTEGTPC
jgi:hypothetical protein